MRNLLDTIELATQIGSNANLQGSVHDHNWIVLLIAISWVSCTQYKLHSLNLICKQQYPD